MIKNSYVFIFLLLIVACKTSQKHNKSLVDSDVNQLLFSLETTSCMGPCPVFDLKLYADSTFYFSGKANTDIAGEHSSKLKATDYTILVEKIEGVEWGKLDKKYVSEMLDLPTRKFLYQFEEDSIYIYQNSLKPTQLSKLSDDLLLTIQTIINKAN